MSGLDLEKRQSGDLAGELILLRARGKVVVAGEVAAFALVLTSDANQDAYTYHELSTPVRLFAGVTYRIAGAGNENEPGTTSRKTQPTKPVL